MVNGPYYVQGDIPLVYKTQVVSEYGEPLTWRKDRIIETHGDYDLCRCGRSTVKPFCDGTHNEIDFDGTEAADTRTTVQREELCPGTRIIVKRDLYLCMDSGFCGTIITNVDELVSRTDDTQVRSLVMAMIERCPSGALSYCIEENDANIEPDLPLQIAVTTEITAQGPIDGPLWVTGEIPIERADGQPFENRNRVTLCRCGNSEIKPLCDGIHRRQVVGAQPNARHT